MIGQSGIYAERFLIFVPLSRNDASARTGLLGEACRSLGEHLDQRFGGADFRAMSPRPAFCVGSVTMS